MRATLRPALVLLGLFTLLTGVAYPVAVTAVAQTLFPHQADGSLVRDAAGRVVGSDLVGQESFGAAGRLWGRPSATAPVPYTPLAADRTAGSGGSNLGPTNPALAQAVAARAAALRASDPAQTAPIPVDLVTASGSGLDPHVSPAAAAWQVPRIARERGMTEAAVRTVVAAHTEAPELGLLGAPRVNVQAVNRALDARAAPAPRPPATPR